MVFQPLLRGFIGKRTLESSTRGQEGVDERQHMEEQQETGRRIPGTMTLMLPRQKVKYKKKRRAGTKKPGDSIVFYGIAL
jgi:hypothetical protein